MLACLTLVRGSLLRPLRRTARFPTVARSFTATLRLLGTLAVLEHKQGKVSSHAFPVVTAATKFGAPVTVFLAGSDSKSVAVQVAKLNGVKKVFFVPNEAYDKVQPSPRLGSDDNPCAEVDDTHSSSRIGST